MYSSHVRASRSQFTAKLRSLSFKLLSCKFSHCGDGTSRALMDSEIGHAWCYIIGVETPNFSLSGDRLTLANIEGEIKLILSLLAALELSNFSS